MAQHGLRKPPNAVKLLCRHLNCAVDAEDLDYVRDVVRHRKDTEELGWTKNDKKHGGTVPQLEAEFDTRAAAFLARFDDTTMVETETHVRASQRHPGDVNFSRHVFGLDVDDLPHKNVPSITTRERNEFVDAPPGNVYIAPLKNPDGISTRSYVWRGDANAFVVKTKS